MTDRAAPPPGTPASRPNPHLGDRPRHGLLALCLAELVSWGLLYYSLPVAVIPIAADTGWSQTTTTAALTVGLIVSALAGIKVGRMLDVIGPRTVMTTGAGLGVIALLIVAASQNMIVFFAGWLLAGFAQSATLYPPAFAVITRWYGAERVKPLTMLTLVGGLASTVFAPIIAFLLGRFEWRITYVILAAILLLTVVPLHWFFLNARWTDRAAVGDGPGGSGPGENGAEAEPTGGPDPATTSAPGESDSAGTSARKDDTPAEVPSRDRVRAVTRSPRFLLLQVAMSLATFTLFAVTINIIPLLTHRGVGYGLAAIALGLVGFGQVSGRLGYLSLEKHTSPRLRIVVLFTSGAVGLWLLAFVPGPIWLLIGIAMVTGGVRGCLTLLQATAVSDRWGTHDFGAINGIFIAPITALTAFAPVAGPGFADLLGGYPAMTMLMAGVITVATLLSAKT